MRNILFITLVATLGGLLFGYDTAVISGAIGFLRDYFELSDAMVGWAASSALVGCIIGVAFAGWFSDRFGRRTTLMAAALLFVVSALGTSLPRSFDFFVFFRILGGVGVGAASMTSPMYIAEIAPAKIRGRLVSLNQLTIVSGMLLVYFVNYFIEGLGDATWNIRSGWRWMFASEALPAIILLVSLFFVPESPRWVPRSARQGNDWRLLFSGKLRKVLVIGIVLAILQQVTGINVILYYGPELFKNIAGAAVDSALLQTVVIGVTNVAFTVVAIRLVDRVGRKPLMIVGAAGMGICLTAVGLAAYFGAIGGWLLLFMVGYIAFFAISVGPVTWVILSEIFPSRIRGRALGIATLFLWSANWLVSQTFPMLDGSETLIRLFNHGFPFWLYAIFCLVLLIFMMTMVPETKGKTLEEIEEEGVTSDE